MARYPFAQTHVAAAPGLVGGYGLGTEADRPLLAIAIRCSIVVNVVFSMSTFHSAIVPTEYSSIQQLVSLLLWLFVICASGFMRPAFPLMPGSDTVILWLFYGFIGLSFLWSAKPDASAMKCAALLTTTAGAYCLITRMSIDDIISDTAKGLFLLSVATLYYVFFVPEIGIDSSWMHGGQWQGVYDSKQSVGVVGAFLIFFSFYQKLTGRHGWLVFLLVFSTAVICVLGSGSRGGGALGLAACAGLYLSWRSIPLMRLFSFGPSLMTIAAAVLIGYLYVTGYRYLPLFGLEVDLTERTFIWQYAISHIDDAPLLGFGLNGFWTIPKIYDEYNQNHGWVLDNYHNGYLAILVETGFVGFLLFFLTTILFAARVSFVIANKTISRIHCAMIVAFALLNFQINFTEWTFVRSTTFTSVLLVAFMFGIARAATAERLLRSQL